MLKLEKFFLVLILKFWYGIFVNWNYTLNNWYYVIYWWYMYSLEWSFSQKQKRLLCSLENKENWLLNVHFPFSLETRDFDKILYFAFFSNGEVWSAIFYVIGDVFVILKDEGFCGLWGSWGSLNCINWYWWFGNW